MGTTQLYLSNSPCLKYMLYFFLFCCCSFMYLYGKLKKTKIQYQQLSNPRFQNPKKKRWIAASLFCSLQVGININMMIVCVNCSTCVAWEQHAHQNFWALQQVSRILLRHVKPFTPSLTHMVSKLVCCQDKLQTENATQYSFLGTQY